MLCSLESSIFWQSIVIGRSYCLKLSVVEKRRLIVFENLREDWRTHDQTVFRQGLWVMVVYRFGRWRYTIRWRWLRMPFSFLYKVLKVLSEILTGIVSFPARQPRLGGGSESIISEESSSVVTRSLETIA